MKNIRLLLAVVFSGTLLLTSCGPKDAAIKTSIEAALAADQMMKGATVSVKDGIATISGECKDEACKAMCEKTVAGIKGVKSVVNNCTVFVPVPEPMPVSVTTVLDEATQQKVKDGLKDIKGVTVEFAGEKAVLSGEVLKSDRMKIMQMLASAKVKSDVSKLMDKK
jgi:hyperosmotically inducible periplasmic protein